MAARGAKTIELDLRSKRAARDALLGVLLGPSGTLRAPALRVGKTLLVGFSEEAYEQLLG